MNIAIIIPTLSGGGAERVAKIVGDYYVERGDRVYYFLADTNIKQAYPVKGQIINTGIKVCTSNIVTGNLQVWFKLVKNSFQIRKYKKRYKIDIAISFMEEANYMNILSRGKEKVIIRICIILSQNGDWVTFLHNKKLIHFFYPMADKVVVLCDYARDDMYKNFGIPTNKMVKIPNPALVPDKCETDLEWPYGDKVIVTVGRLEAQKQQERIIRAFSYVYARDQAARLLVLGVGPKKKYLENIRKEYELEDVVILAGFKNNVSYYLKNCKVFVMASSAEGFPNSMIEAMANGLPVITTDTPGACGEIVGKKNRKVICNDIQYCPFGILTPYISGQVQMDSELTREEYLLGKVLLKILNDKSLREKYSECSLKRASMFNTVKVMSKWDRLLGR